jgi:hypothetical protein
MIWQQSELPLFVQPTNSSAPQRPHRSRKTSEPRYLTTQEVVKLLNLSNARPLYSARANGAAYRQENQIVVPAGSKNKWEIFRRDRA